jgi:hypothetical protein
MASSGMLRYVVLVRTDVTEELNASFIGVIRIGELGTTLAVTSNRRTLRRNTKHKALSSSETSVLTRATRRNIPEDVILLYMKEVQRLYVEWPIKMNMCELLTLIIVLLIHKTTGPQTVLSTIQNLKSHSLSRPNGTSIYSATQQVAVDFEDNIKNIYIGNVCTFYPRATLIFPLNSVCLF